jgi:LysR family transcriptional regulator, glycine cleavage system transcriptional activator
MISLDKVISAMPMSRRLPPLNAMRAFEAVARHRSFTRAAEELHVTQAAISHQIKILEVDLGVQLFHRQRRQPLLTESGATLLGPTKEALDLLADAVDAISGKDRSQTLTIGITPQLSAKWLTPRLARFGQRYPDVQLRLHHSIYPINFSRQEADVAVHWGDGKWPGLKSELLFSLDLTPMCSPGLLAVGQPLRRPGDLRHHQLLHYIDHTNWRDWLIAAGAAELASKRGPIMDDYNVLIQGAIDGLGVALAPARLMADHLSEARLVMPFTLSIAPDFAYYMVYPPESIRRPKVRAFRDWLKAEAAIGAN